MCSKQCGTLNPTTMVLDGSCHAFGNRDGTLFCDKEMENDANIPKGLYQGDCGGCSYNEETHMLTCKKCRGKGNVMVESSIEVKEGCDVVNEDGVLTCREDVMADGNAKKQSDEKKEL